MLHLSRVCLLLVLCCWGSVIAAEKGTPQEAEAMVKKAIALIQQQGGEKAYTQISDPKGPFVERDMYVYVSDLKGTILAHGVTPKVIGKDITHIRDANGKYVMKEILEIAKTRGRGWVDYQWPNPMTKVIEPKSTYVERVGEVMVACGIYKQ